MKSKSKIYLIGLPGVGKSHFGRVLTADTNIPLIDLDKWIEEKEAKKITEIFSEQGESRFRAIEAQALRHITETMDSFILSTGGGSPCFHQGIEYMNNNGVTIYLTVERAILLERLKNSQKRPLMQENVEEKIETLLKTRSAYYEKADFTLPHRNTHQLMEAISELEIKS